MAFAIIIADHNKCILPEGSVNRTLILKLRKQKKLNITEGQTIVNAFVEDPLTSLRTIQKDQEVNSKGVSHTTISTTLKNERLKTFRIPTIQYITERQKKQRVTLGHNGIQIEKVDLYK